MLQDFLGIAVVGAVMSIIIEMVKVKYGTEGTKTKLITVGLSIMFGTAYFFLSQLNFWPSVLGVFAAASTFYAVFLKS
jgi:hypothetical protein